MFMFGTGGLLNVGLIAAPLTILDSTSRDPGRLPVIPTCARLGAGLGLVLVNALLAALRSIVANR